MPWTGSTRKSATSSRASSRSSASRSLNGTRAKPGSSGSKRSRNSAQPLADSEPSVRPWKPCSAETTRGRAGRGAAELDRRLDRLGAGVREEDAVDRGGQPLDERLREPRGDRRDPELDRVRRLRLQVLDQRRLDARVVAPDREHAEAAEQVEVLDAVRVGEVRAARAGPALVEPDRPQHAHELRVDRARPRLERVVPVAGAVRPGAQAVARRRADPRRRWRRRTERRPASAGIKGSQRLITR